MFVDQQPQRRRSRQTMSVQEEPLALINLSGSGKNLQSKSATMQQQDSKNSNSDSESSMNGGNLSVNNDNRFNAYLNRGSELWTHWTWLGGQGKMSLMKCNYCQVNKQLKNAPKCRRHLIKCQKTPELVRKYFERKELEASRVSAFLREVRSKEAKFPRNENRSQNNQSMENGSGGSEMKKSSQPTANDLKHLNSKQSNCSTIHYANNGKPINNGNRSSITLRSRSPAIVPQSSQSSMTPTTPTVNHQSSNGHSNGISMLSNGNQNGNPVGANPPKSRYRGNGIVPPLISNYQQTPSGSNSVIPASNKSSIMMMKNHHLHNQNSREMMNGNCGPHRNTIIARNSNGSNDGSSCNDLNEINHSNYLSTYMVCFASCFLHYGFVFSKNSSRFIIEFKISRFSILIEIIFTIKYPILLALILSP